MGVAAVDAPETVVKRRGRPPGSKTKAAEPTPEDSAPVQDIEEVPELTPEPLAPAAPVVMKKKAPPRVPRASTPAPPSAGDIADALLSAWEGRKGQRGPGRAALYSSWM